MTQVSERQATSFSRDALRIDAAGEAQRLSDWLRQGVHGELRRQGAVVGISGGVDSSVVLALCVRAFGAERVLGVLLPERESSPESEDLAHLLAGCYGVATVTEDITGALDGAGCYRRRDEAIRQLFPDYGAGWKAKIVLPGNLLERDGFNIFSLTVIAPGGHEYNKRLPLGAYYQIVAASNFKQRTRMAMLYYHGELHNYAVIGTPNKNEHDLGFFVKHGDGGADIRPIVHLFKSQVYQLAEYLGVPEEIRSRPPTTDTYSAASTQEEFFFRVPFEILDLVWLGHERQVDRQEIAVALGLTAEQVDRVMADIVRKQRTTAYLRTAALEFAHRE